MLRNATLPLTMVSVGQRVRLSQINTGEQFAHRLAEMSLTPGTEMAIVQDNGGPILISVRDSRLALGQGMAHKLAVELISYALPS